ncbi:MAG TPA: EAL domain-containing protein [Candidatus Sulfotelmatobacter sp.]|nr:EAL domain-containing protein [Candidatus Sulfotelmatobacter sp.]
MPELAAKPGGLRTERDRFLAFAFAAADALIELDAEGQIRYAAGATRALLASAPDDLIGRPIMDLLTLADRAAFRSALQEAGRGGRFAPIVLNFLNGSRALQVSGSTLPEHPGVLFLALRTQTGSNEGGEVAAGIRDRRTLLRKSEAFSALATAALQTEDGRAAPYRMSLLETNGLQKLGDRLQQTVADELFSEIGGLLRRHSAGGDSAAQLGDDKYGLVHEPGADIDALRRSIEAVTRKKDPSGAGVKVATTTMDLAARGGDDADSTQALLYAINSFSAGRNEMTMRDLSEGSKPLLVDAVRRIVAFRQTIAASRFEVAFQPVVDLQSRAVQHYEALARLPGHDSPYESIVFAENVGLIADFDLAMVHKVLAQLGKAKMRGDAVRVAINISGRSLTTPAFLTALHKLLRSYHMLTGHVLFEITESAEMHDLEVAGNAIASLRTAGYPVCLDDFGAGATAFHYLHALIVDYVKIDGAYVRDAVGETRHLPFLKAMIQLCRDLKVSSIGEMVETEASAEFLQRLGMQFAQGFLFGKPALGLPAVAPG